MFDPTRFVQAVQTPTVWKALILALVLWWGRSRFSAQNPLTRIFRRAFTVSAVVSFLYALVTFVVAAFSLSTASVAELGTRLLIILFLGYFAWEGVEFLLTYLSTRLPVTDELARRRMQTLTTVGRWVGRLIILFIVGTMLLDVFHVNVTPLIASASVVGLALSLGSQKVIQDIIAGIFILLEDQFHVGDGVEVAGVAGIVEEMTLRVTKVRDFQGYLHIIPNSEISVVTNRNREWTRAIADVGVAYDSDLNRVRAVLEEVGQALYEENPDGIFLEAPMPLGPEALADSSINFRLIARVKAGQHWDAQRLMRQRIKEAFDRAGIEIPFPQLDVHMRQG